MRTLFFQLSLLLHFTGLDARTVEVRFMAPTRPDSTSNVQSGDSLIHLNTLKFHITGIRLDFTDGSSANDSTARLIDLSDDNTYIVSLPIANTSRMKTLSIRFGTDSTTNVKGALGGDLDPMNGMYWTWQSGYINYKLEGAMETNGRSMPFEFHLGGYRLPYATDFIERYDCSADTIEIRFDIQKFMRSLPIDLGMKVMSPGSKAAIASKSFTSSFLILNP
jgi:hypothetical protein